MLPSLSARLMALGQEHILKAWGETPEEAGLIRLSAQMDRLDAQYPGGLAQYVATAQRLLSRSDPESDNPLSGQDISVPEGVTLDLATAPDTNGLRALGTTAFVLVAGGLGERLGFSGIKLALPVETSTGQCYLSMYARWIKMIEDENTGVAPLPFVLMTSDDTHRLTVDLLEENAYFGLMKEQVILLKQEKVPALADVAGRFAMAKGDPYCIDTKPHGHGDVHLVLRQAGLPQQWLERGLKHILFFQDTNAGTLFTAALSAHISVTSGFAMNSTSIPRKPKEAIGAITRLVDQKTGRERIINVEYNVIEANLPGGDTADPTTGFSALPGNINTFILDLATYARVLHDTQGLMPEFINPKYTDSTKTAFKSPTRLECMMQDYAGLLRPTDKVGFSQFPRWCYTPVKNRTEDGAQKATAGLDPACAASGECEFYASWVRLLRSVGVTSLRNPDLYPQTTFLGVPVRIGVMAVLSSSFAPSRDKLKLRFPTPEKVKISDRSALIVDGAGICIHSLDLDGALEIYAAPGAEVMIKGLVVKNRGWAMESLQEAAAVSEPVRMRGFVINKMQTERLVFEKPGRYTVEEGVTSSL